MNGDSELIILSASGGTLWRVARPLVALAILVALGVSLVNHVVMPWTLRKLRLQVVELRTDLLSQVVQPGKFTAADGGAIILHIRDRKADGELVGILMHDTRDPKQMMSYLAERGAVIREGQQSFLVMQDGSVLRRVGVDAAPEILTFQSYALDLDGFERKVGAFEWKPRERYTSELVGSGSTNKDGTADGRARAELHERLSNPLYPIVFVFIALAFVGQPQSTRTSRVQATSLAFLAAVGVRLAGLGLNNLAVIKGGAIVGLYALPLAVIALCVVVMRRNANPRPRSRWALGLSDWIEDAGMAVLGSMKRLAWWTARPPVTAPSRHTTSGS